jgi:hypothetical protein
MVQIEELSFVDKSIAQGKCHKELSAFAALEEACAESAAQLVFQTKPYSAT